MAILENWNEVSNAQEVAADSLGTTEQKYADYMDSIEAHMNQLSTTWSQFLLNMDLSGKANTVIDAISGIVSVLDFLINKTPAATIVVTALTAALVRLAAVKFAGLSSSIIDLANKIISMKGAFSDMHGFAAKSGNIFSTLKDFFTGKNFSGAAESIKGVGTALTTVKTGAAGAASSVTTLGGALGALAPYIAVVAGIGVALYAVPKIIDAIITTDEELKESIQTTQDSITESQSTIDDYNTTLQQNKDRIEEINSLKGTSDWSSDLDKEADSLERQNAMLEQKIKLEERQQELQKEQLYDDQKELFDREFLDSESISSYKQQAMYDYDGNLDYYTTVAGESQSLAGVDRMKQMVENQKTLIDTYKKNAEEFEKTGDQMFKDQADSYEDLANKQETEITDMIGKLMDYREAFEGVDDATVKQIDDMLNVLYETPTMSGETVGEILGIGDAASDASEQIKTLADDLIALTGVEFMPQGFESMDSWLSTISEEDLPKVQEMLQNTTHSSQALKDILSNMSGEDAVQYLVSAYNEFHGIVEDCTASLSEFNTALETDYDEQITGYGQMLDYVMKSQKNGIKNAKAYRAALEGIGLEAGASDEEVAALYDAVDEYMRFDSSGNLQKNLQAFWDDMKTTMDAAAKSGKDLGNINEETGEVSISSYKEMADAMGLPEQAFMALMRASELFYDITETNQQTGLQVMLQDIANKAKEAGEALEGTIDSALKYGGIESVTNADFGVQYNFADTEFGQEAKQNVINQINNTKSELESIAKQSGLKLDIDVPFDLNIDSSDYAVSQAASSVQNVKDSIQKLIDDAGNIDTSAFTNIASDIAESMPDDIEVDGNNITFKTDDAANAFVTQLQTSFEGLDVGSVISNAIASGISFEGTGGAGADAFSGVADSIASGLVESINSALSAQEIAYTGALDTALEGVSGKVGDVSGSVDVLIQKLQEADGTSLGGVKGQIDGVNTSATNANSSVSNLATALASLPSNKTVTLTFETNYTGSIPTPTSGDVPSANGRQMPAYANGKMGKPLRVQRNANSLVGEEGTELVISKSGQQKLVGENGAELVHLNAGDTVIPANVTSMIRQGQIGSFASGKYGTSGALLATPSGWTTISNYSSKYQGGSSSGSSSSSGGGSSSRGSSSSGGGSSSSGGGSSSSSEDPAEDLIAELEHRRNMEYITEEQYLDELTKIWETYYKGKEEFRDKDWDLEEKIHDLHKQMIEDEIDTLEYQNGILERTYGTENQQIQNLVKMQNLYHQQAEEYRANGFDDLSPEIRELSEAWWDAYDEIKDLQNQMFENEIENLDHYIGLLDSKLERIPEVFDDFSLNMEDFTEKLNDNLDQYMGIQSQKVKLYEQQLASIQRELNRLYQDGYEKNRDIIMDLEQQAEDVKGNILDIAEQVRDMKLDAIQKQLDRQGELQQAIIEYAEEQVEVLEKEIELLEKENEEKEEANELERLQQALENAKQNRMKRVYHADTGY